MANVYLNQTFGGLGTVTFKAPEAAIYNVDGSSTIPTITTGAAANSALVVTINKNGSPVYTGSAGARGFATQVSCAAADVITIVLTSATASDASPNVIKTTISISE